MALYALLPFPAEDTILEYRDFATPPPDISRKGRVWRPVVDVDQPYAPLTQIKTGPVVTFEPGVRVVRTWTVTNKTAQQIDDEKQNAVDAEMNANDYRLLKAVVLAIADGTLRSGITPAQARQAIKAKL